MGRPTTADQPGRSAAVVAHRHLAVGLAESVCFVHKDSITITFQTLHVYSGPTGIVGEDIDIDIALA
jgi:hypothetical protein